MEVSGKLQTPAALSPEKGLQLGAVRPKGRLDAKAKHNNFASAGKRIRQSFL
jgi:hypothetical protein